MARPAINGVLRRNTVNPRYFTDASGRAIFLTGTHTWNNLVDMGPGYPPMEFDFNYYLDVLDDLNHNFIRLWTWDSLRTWNPVDRVRPLPWARTGPGDAADGQPRLDLDRHDEEYFARLRDRVAAAQARGIYVSVMLFESWEVFRNHMHDLGWHALAGPNNVNDVDITACEKDGALVDWIGLGDPRVTAVQEAYVRRVVETVNRFDNVLYEISNEAGAGSHAWQEHFIDFVRRCEAGLARQHPVGVTGGLGTVNEWLYGTSAEWVSAEGWASEGEIDGYREGEYTWGSAPHDRADKVVLLDTDHLWGIGGDEVWAWKSFCRGYNVLYMDRCDDFPSAFYEHEWWPEKFNPVLRREMGHLLRYAERMDLNAATPHNDLCSTGYCLANPGREYLCYRPAGGEFTVRLEPGDYTCEWHDPGTGETREGASVTAGADPLPLQVPFTGGAVAYLQRA
jgi:hypothetical protein